MIQTTDLCIRYGSQTVLRHATLNVAEGGITGIVGPSGCGKSSFLLALNRLTDLIPGAAISGEIKIAGRDVYQAWQALDLRRRVGLIFQKPNPFPLSIRENIQLALRDHGLSKRRQLDEVTEQVLRAVGLWEEVHQRLERSALQLSGGQQQRLCLARALALEPQVLLMDEPCSALDPIAAAQIESLITSLRERYTILIVTHNLAQARRIADRVAVFWFRDGVGEIIEVGPTEQIFTAPKSQAAAEYLGGKQG